MHNTDRKPGLFETVRHEMRLRNYSNQTIKAYVSCLRSFVRYIGPRHPRECDSDNIREFLLHLLTEKRWQASTVNQVINVLRFLYTELYKRPFVIDPLPRPKKERKLPDILNQDEVLRIFEAVENLKHKLMLMLAYASGLRVSEVVRLRIEDIDAERLLIHIRCAKGKKDRYVNCSESILKPLHIYWGYYNLGREGWLFPGQRSGHHLSIRSIQAVFERAVQTAGITKPVSMHTLRHSYATHSLEHGYDIRYIQKLLGHESLKTTEIYTHVITTDLARIRSPLDFLLKGRLPEGDQSERKKLTRQRDED